MGSPGRAGAFFSRRPPVGVAHRTRAKDVGKERNGSPDMRRRSKLVPTRRRGQLDRYLDHTATVVAIVVAIV
jgi:hypothetical protein